MCQPSWSVMNGAILRHRHLAKADKNMKRILCAALALTLLGSTAAQARGWGHGGWGHGGHHGWHGGNVGLGFGLGFLGLGLLAEAAREDDRYDRDRERAYYDRQYHDRAMGYEGRPAYDPDGDRDGRAYDRDNGPDQGGPDQGGAYDRDDRGGPDGDRNAPHQHGGDNAPVDDDDQ